MIQRLRNTWRAASFAWKHDDATPALSYFSCSARDDPYKLVNVPVNIYLSPVTWSSVSAPELARLIGSDIGRHAERALLRRGH